MALETLVGVKQIGGFRVIVMDELRDQYPEKFNESGAMDYKWFEADIRPHDFIYVRHDVNSISFNLQNGPVKEKGINGCQVLTMIQAAKFIIEKLNEKFPCDENDATLAHLSKAIEWQEERTRNREKRNVEGTNQA